MTEEVVASPEPLIDVDPVQPAPGADEQKPNADPASAADAQKTEEADTPEQQEAKRESRRAGQRARARERHAAELAAAQTEARMLRELLQARQPQPGTGEPKRESYADYESYLEARTDWRAEQKVQATLKAEREANQSRAVQEKEEAGNAEVATAWVKREEAFEATTEDYQDVVGPYVKKGIGELSNAARRLIVESDVGPQLLYLLGDSSEEHARIAALSEPRQVIELNKLELKMSAPAAKTASNAPAPIKHTPQGRSAPNGFSENMSQADYEKWRIETSGSRPRWAR